MPAPSITKVSELPTIALAMGDPAGISPELAAKALASDEIRHAARLIVLGDARILAEGARIAGIGLDLPTVTDLDEARAMPGHVMLDLHNLAPAEVTTATATRAGGLFAVENFRRALLAAQAGRLDAVVFTPFNKYAMRQAYAGYDDDSRFICDVLKWSGPAREFNVLPKIWNARVTSHIPISGVASAINRERILAELTLTDATLRASGVATPRIAVAGLNPHCGDGGNFGREEIEIIEPAIETAQANGLDVAGPYPCDTVFPRAIREGFHAVLTMYHDQGQIAMKLLGFEEGVTMFGGLPFPVCTPAHGTAYDIVGKGIADIGATRAAILLAARQARR